MRSPRGGPRGGRGPAPEPPRWQKGTDVRGIVPPGRRLDPEGTKARRWSASGVNGVVPPARPSASSPAWLERPGSKKPRSKGKDAQRALDKARRGLEAETWDPGRPMAGFVPAIFDDQLDPDNLAALLDLIRSFVENHRPDAARAESFSELIHQSHAPYELVVGFTVLSALVGKKANLRRKYALALERGAKAFYNLARRLKQEIKVPRGLAPETLDPIFFSLPDIALAVPHAYATDAFCRQIELLRESNPGRDRELVEQAEGLRRRFIMRRTYGDQALRDLFPWSPPAWAPPPVTDGPAAS